MTTPNLPAPLASLPTVDPFGDRSPRALPGAVADSRFADEEVGIDWRRVLSALLRFKWLILAVSLLGTAAGVGATRLLAPEYLAQATIWIDESDRRAAEWGPGPIRPGQLLDPGAWVDLLQSYVVLDQVARDQRLFLRLKSPADRGALAALRVADQYRPGSYRLSVDAAGRAWTLATVDGVELERGAVGDSIGARLGIAWAPNREVLFPGKSVEFTLSTLRDAARGLAQGLRIQMPPNGNFLRLELSGYDPVRIAAILNALAERYVSVAAELKREKLTELTKILDEQLRYAQQTLRDAEGALEGFRVRTITLSVDRAGADAARDPAFTSFVDAQLERDAARRDREALERLLAQVGDSGFPAEALGAIGSVQRTADLAQTLKELAAKQAQLRALRYGYTDAYPPVQRLAAEIATLERHTIPDLTRGLAAELGARATALDQRIEVDSRGLRQIPPRAIEEARLRRGVQLAENLYTTLQRRYEEARVADASTIPDVRILDSAVVPQRPVRNTAPRILVLAFLGSLGLAVVGAVLLDRVDPRVRYPDQVSRDMGLTILGAVPHLKARGANGDRAGWKSEEIAEVVEALRGVCLNLVYAYGAAGPMLVTITSPGSGDGKSFLAANLAHTFAEGGHRTLLLDADIRRGVLHRRLSGRRRPGLTDCLRGEVPFEAIVQETSYPSLAFIGCGTRVHNAPELLSSPAMTQLINRVRPGYDVILIDSPPLAGGVDPFILGTLTGNLLIVLRTGYSHRELVAAKLEVLDRLPVRLLGAVLNDVPPEAGYRNYYSYYLPGYEAADEHTEGRSLVIR